MLLYNFILQAAAILDKFNRFRVKYKYTYCKGLIITEDITIYVYRVEDMKILHHKEESEALKPIINHNLDFIARNIIYPEPHTPDQKKDVSLNNIMTHLGGSRGEIDYLSYIYKKRIERMQEK